MADVSVRLARVTDVEALAALQVQIWRATYAEFLPAATLEALDTDTIAATWRTAILEPPPGTHRLLVALHGDELAGYAATGPAEDPDQRDRVERVVELRDLAVAPAAQRGGHGSRLMSALVDYARGDGFDVAVMWIPLRDSITRVFLETCGWARDGALRTLDLDGSGAVELQQIRLATSLEA